jgi:UDP-glucose 4-epimerase
VKALVTGGSGFVGGALVDNLVKYGYDTSVFDKVEPKRRDVKFIKASINDLYRLENAVEDVDVVFHAAGILGTDWLVDHIQESNRINVEGSLNVFELAREKGFRVVNLGLIPEWNSPYMITKNAAKQYGLVYNAHFGTDIRTVELAHAYGPKQKVAPVRKAIPNFIVNALLGEDLIVYGEKPFKFMDCLYVDDAADDLRLIAENKDLKGEIIQLGCGKGISVDELAEKIIELTKSKSRLKYKPMRPGEPQGREAFIAADLTKWRKCFNQPTSTISLDEGLRRSIAWYRANGEIDLAYAIFKAQGEA